MFHVYVLRSAKTGRRYIGSCENVDERVRRHNAGHSKATRHGIPWRMLHSESFATRKEAVAKENYYKTGRGREELAKLDVYCGSKKQDLLEGVNLYQADAGLAVLVGDDRRI